MKTIIKYVLLDLLRNRVILFYTIILAVLAVSVLGIDDNPTKGLLSLLNITLLFVPLITILFSTIYFFNAIEFTELLLSQPIKRNKVLLAEYSALTVSLSTAYAVGIGIPLLLLVSGIESFILTLIGILLTFVFSSLALLIFVKFRDKTKGIGIAIAIALFFTLLFDGFLLAFIYSFSDYPIDQAVVGIIAFNPIDLARVLMLLHLDVAVLMGYSGALFKKFLGSATGSIFSIACIMLWIIVPLLLSVRIFNRKDL
ncbi:ABC transporter permease subunit [Chitinophaga ginsengisoli]|uniref:Cu-processing system permease protein n=1 Tax=Chitinophaga ginsengisoli TaxID=363837 RepID=A0A2P8FKZ0_9BACT|nr:ABC transporter permease subunit [Chitinophaga ginsengisoli]PSL22407.1 Cu-processing system permease protein [Chitinophaga ginsengisoli]